jgi:hypothetical protein
MGLISSQKKKAIIKAIIAKKQRQKKSIKSRNRKIYNKNKIPEGNRIIKKIILSPLLN